MKNASIICLLLLLLCTAAEAQHDLYRWQLSGYSGVATYINNSNSFSDYYKPDHNLFHQAELTYTLGNGFGVSAGYSYGQVFGQGQQQTSFRTKVHLLALRAYYYTDIGYLLRSSSRVSPYFFLGYGLGNFRTSSGRTNVESTYVPAIPFGIGLKFRVAERWQLALQSEVVYLQDPHLQAAELEQNSYNSAYIHTGIKLGYNFGFRKSTFRAASYYANDVAVLQKVASQDQPRQNMLEAMLRLEPRKVQLKSTSDSTDLVQEQLTGVTLVPPATPATRPDTLTNRVAPDTSQVQRNAELDGNRLKQQQDSTRVAQQQRKEATLDRVTDTTAAVRRQVAPATRQANRRQREVAEPAQPVVTERIVTEGPERVVYVPAEDRRATVPVVTNVRAGRSRETNKQVNELQERNRKLQRSIDSLQTMQQDHLSDILASSPATDAGMVQFLQQQAALNQNMLQRLSLYEQELALLRIIQDSSESQFNAEALAETAATTIFYPINTYQIPVASLPELNGVLGLLQQTPASEVKLIGYASKSGKAAYNLALSRKRVQTLVNFLVNQGVEKERISIQYLGDAKAANNENPLDRKVVIKLN
ncbi:OmpA family protein [Pontibacter sp. 13R65]|uniref:OmpA family protein n=1 Tax=Pontibacter sp. 13R65 TaxID=3127458 RepID=UPI00301CBDCB